MKIHREMEFDDVRITAKGIIDKYQSKDEKPKITLLKVFKDHNERCATLAGKEDMSPATVMKPHTVIRRNLSVIVLARILFRCRFSLREVVVLSINIKQHALMNNGLLSAQGSLSINANSLRLFLYGYRAYITPHFQ